MSPVPNRRALSLGIALAILVQTALCHGHESQEMGMEMPMSPPALNSSAQAVHKEYSPTYFAHAEHAGLIYAHITLSVVAWVFILPVGK